MISFKHTNHKKAPQTLNPKGTDLVEVVAVQVTIDPEEPPEDRPNGISEVLGERDPLR